MLNFARNNYLSRLLFSSKKEISTFLLNLFLYLVFIALMYTGIFITWDLDKIIDNNSSNREVMIWIAPEYKDEFRDWTEVNNTIVEYSELNIDMDKKIGFVLLLESYTDRHKLFQNIPDDIGIPSIATHFMDAYVKRLAVIKISIILFVVILSLLFCYVNLKVWKSKCACHQYDVSVLSVLGYSSKEIKQLVSYQIVKNQMLEIILSLLIYRIFIWPIFSNSFDYVLGNSINIIYCFDYFKMPVIVVLLILTTLCPIILEKHLEQECFR